MEGRCDKICQAECPVNINFESPKRAHVFASYRILLCSHFCDYLCFLGSFTYSRRGAMAETEDERAFQLKEIVDMTVAGVPACFCVVALFSLCSESACWLS